jgi:hypothetical protein
MKTTAPVHSRWLIRKPQSTVGRREYTSCAGSTPIESAHRISAPAITMSASVSTRSVGASVAYDDPGMRCLIR